jgi:hypothetical protein
VRAWPTAAAAVLAALAAPATASAHIRAGTVATGYRARITSAPAGPVTVVVYPADRALGMRVAPGHRVTVLGPSGRPLLRVAGKATWHDPRVRGLPPGVRRAAWTVPLLVDGRPASVRGELWRVPAPAPWPWVALGLVVAAAWVATPAARRARTLGLLAAAATVLTALAFAVAGSASAGRRVEAFDEIVCAAAGVGLLLRGNSPALRGAAAAGLGLVALLAGMFRFAALTHGVVLSALPAGLARGLVALTLWAGAAAVLAAALSDEWEAAGAPAPSAPRP